MVSLKYARVERERRWLLANVPGLGGAPTEITDHYLVGTRLRLREVASAGSVVRKLGHKVRLGDGPGEVACTNFYLDEEEWCALLGLPADALHKRRWVVEWGEVRVAVDVFDGPLEGLVLAEIDRGDGPNRGLPEGLDAVAEVTSDEVFTGSALAGATRAELAVAVGRYGVELAEPSA